MKMEAKSSFQCCNAQIDGGGGWGIFSSLLGWENSATYGSVISYNLYWLLVIAGFLGMRFNERKGHWPLMKPKNAKTVESETASVQCGAVSGVKEESKDISLEVRNISA